MSAGDMSAARIAVATPSYAGDLERCRLLCESMDRFLAGHATHYLLVEDADVALFAPLAGPKRRVLAESELLPPWFRPLRRAFGGRRLWTSPGALLRGVLPLRGWHAQQLRKLALARAIDEDAILFADSDMVFARPFDAGSLFRDGALRLFRVPGGIQAGMAEHVAWCRSAARLLGLAAPGFPCDDYINILVSWRSDTARALLDHVERLTGRDWVTAVARDRRFSEYMLYGLYAASAHVPAGAHWLDALPLGRVYWDESAGDLHGLTSFEPLLAPGQVAFAAQSFLGLPMERLRALYAAQPGP